MPALGFGHGTESVRLIESAEKKSIKIRISGYLKHPDPKRRRGSQHDDESEAPLAGELERDVSETFHGKTALIFANAKRDIEKLADYAKRESARRGLPDLFRCIQAPSRKESAEETERR